MTKVAGKIKFKTLYSFNPSFKAIFKKVVSKTKRVAKKKDQLDKVPQKYLDKVAKLDKV